MSAKFETYEAKDGHRWRLRAGNGRIIAESGEAYSSAYALNRAIKAVKLAVSRTVAQDVSTRHKAASTGSFPAPGSTRGL